MDKGLNFFENFVELLNKMLQTPGRMLGAVFGRVSEDNARNGDDSVKKRGPPDIGNELNPMFEYRIDEDVNVEDIGNVEDVKSIEGKPAWNLRDGFGGIIDPDNYDGSLGDGFGDWNGMSFEYLGDTGVNQWRRRPKGRGLSDVLCHELKPSTPRSTTAKIF